MTITGLFDEIATEIELVNFIRNKDIISTSDRGVTTTTETFDGDSSTVAFTVTNSPLANVRAITVGGSSQSYGTDYTLSGNTITFTTAPATGTDNISVQYDYGADDTIVTASAQSIQTISNFPSIVVSVTTSNTTEGDISADSNFTNALITFTVLAVGKANTVNYIKAIRENVLENKKTFDSLRLLTPVSTGPAIPQENKGDKIYLKTLECQAPLIEEVISS